MTLECFEQDEINSNHRRGIAVAGKIVVMGRIDESQFKRRAKDLQIEYETFVEAYLNEEYGFGKPIIS